MAQTSNNDQLRWDESNSRDFLDYGAYFVPERERQIDIICSLIPKPEDSEHILELCCGEGLLCHALLDRFPEARVHGFDGSPTMIESVSKTLAAYGPRFRAQQFDLADRSWRTLPWPVHAVVSSLAIHHLDAEEKQLLFKDVYHALTPGGVFVIADVIQPTTPMGIDLAGKLWDEAVRRRSLALDGSLDAYQRFLEMNWNSFTDPEPDPVDKMSPLFDQLKWLEQAGFVDVDVAWMTAGHAIFSGCKAKA